MEFFIIAASVISLATNLYIAKKLFAWMRIEPLEVTVQTSEPVRCDCQWHFPDSGYLEPVDPEPVQDEPQVPVNASQSAWRNQTGIPMVPTVTPLPPIRVSVPGPLERPGGFAS